jgi:hypothetical protein
MNIHRILKSTSLVAGLSLVLTALPAADAGCYSDWCANQRSGATSSRLTLQYGGTYSQAASNYNNYRWGYGTGRNTHYYSPYYPTGAYPSSRITPAQQADLERLNRQSEALVHRIMTDPLIWR